MKITEIINKYFSNEKCYVLAYTIQNVYLGTYSEVLDIEDYDLNNLLELHIFNHKKEVKTIKNSLELVVVEENNDALVYDEKIFINKELFKTAYSRLVVRNILKFSEDGIVYVASSRYLEVL